MIKINRSMLDQSKIAGGAAKGGCTTDTGTSVVKVVVNGETIVDTTAKN